MGDTNQENRTTSVNAPLQGNLLNLLEYKNEKEKKDIIYNILKYKSVFFLPFYMLLIIFYSLHMYFSHNCK